MSGSQKLLSTCSCFVRHFVSGYRCIYSNLIVVRILLSHCRILYRFSSLAPVFEADHVVMMEEHHCKDALDLKARPRLAQLIIHSSVDVGNKDRHQSPVM